MTKKRGLLVLLLFLAIASVTVFLIWDKDETETKEESEELIPMEITTFLVQDFAEDGTVTWYERKYDLIGRKSSWYRNGVWERDSSSLEIESILDFSLNGRVADGEALELPEPVYDLVYEWSMEESEQFLLQYISEGYEVKRVICDTGFVDIYLKGTDGVVLRAIVTEDQMIFGEMDKSFEMGSLEDLIQEVENEVAE